MRDTITDFNSSGHDRIDLSTIDAVPGGANNSFAFIGTAAFTAVGQVRVMQNGNDALVLVNTSGTGGAEMMIHLVSVQAALVVPGDFDL